MTVTTPQSLVVAYAGILPALDKITDLVVASRIRSIILRSALLDLKGQFHLTTIALTNSAEWFEVVSPQYEYSGKKSDPVLMIDSRSIPEGVTFDVSIGLLEPGNTNVLNSMIVLSPEVEEISANQVLVSTVG